MLHYDQRLDRTLFTEKGRSKNTSLTDIIMIKYLYNGETKSGMVKLVFALNLADDRLEFRRIEYSDADIQSYVRKNPSVLTNVHAIRNT